MSDAEDVEEVEINDNNTSSGFNEDYNNGGATTFRLGSTTLVIGEHQRPYFFMVVASIILLIESVGVFFNEGYAISVAVIAMLLALGALVMTYKMQDKWNSMGKYIAYFLLLWNTVGAFILTFDGPFIVTSNAYFASWALSIFAFMATDFSFSNLQTNVQNASILAYLLGASIVTMMACIFQGLGPWKSLLGFLIALFTIALCGVLIFMDQKGKIPTFRTPCLALFSCLWVFAVVILTFKNGVFPLTGNGYIGAWLGLISCVYAFSSS